MVGGKKAKGISSAKQIAIGLSREACRSRLRKIFASERETFNGSEGTYASRAESFCAAICVRKCT